MADDTKDPAVLADRLWKEIDKERFGMLGLVDGSEMHHFQPMASFAEKEEGAVYFYTNKSSDLAKDTGASHDVMLVVQAKDQEFQACIHGVLTPEHDRARIDKYWSPFVAAWFPEGKDDPDLIMMKMDAKDARIWASKRGPVNYLFQVAKANATGTLPDVGGKADVTL